MTEGIYVLQEMVERIRSSFHGIDTAYEILVDSKKFDDDSTKYSLAVSLMNNSAVYIASARNFYQENEFLSGFSEIEGYLEAFQNLQFEVMQVVTLKEENLSWFISRHDSFIQAKKEIEKLLERENENYRLTREQHQRNAENFKQNMHKFVTKAKQD